MRATTRRDELVHKNRLVWDLNICQIDDFLSLARLTDGADHAHGGPSASSVAAPANAQFRGEFAKFFAKFHGEFAQISKVRLVSHNAVPLRKAVKKSAVCFGLKLTQLVILENLRIDLGP